jgi:soluble cytochrome b562
LESYITYLIAFLGCVPGVIALIKQLKRDKSEIKKIDIESNSILISDALKLKDEINEQLQTFRCSLLESQKEISDLRADVKKLRTRVSYLRKGIDILICQIEQQGETPQWRPESDDKDF